VFIQFQIETEVLCEPSPQILIISTSGNINHTSSQLRDPEKPHSEHYETSIAHGTRLPNTARHKKQRVIIAQDVVLFWKSFLKKSFD
jgi:hypothetical protein